MTILLEPKRADETRREAHDWSAFLGTDTISGTPTVTSSDVTISGISANGAIVNYSVSGGTNGTNAEIAMVIVTAAGDHETELFVLPIGLDEPISLTDAKRQVRMAQDDSEDAFIASLIPDARAYVERVSRYSFVEASRQETFGSFGDFIEIYRRPVLSVDTVAYVDIDGNEAEYAGFLAPLGRFPLRIYPGVSDSFPTLADGGSVTVSYTTGAVAVGSEEWLVGRRAMLLLIGHWFDDREAYALGTVSPDVDFAIRGLLNSLAPLSAY